MMIFSGNANLPLAKEIVNYLGLPLGKTELGTFSDGESAVEIQENVRGQDVFLIQSTCAPTNDNLMEMLVMIDALHWASVRRITAVIPYFGYARQDRRPRSIRVPITARLAAKMIGYAGANRVLTMDLHSDQEQGFFDILVDNIYSSPVLLAHIWRTQPDDIMVVSPDVGGVVRARALARRLDDADLAIIDKRREKANKSEVMNIIGDVKGRNCIIIDDMIDTAGTLCKGADALKKAGAKSVVAYCTHPVLSGGAVTNINNSQIDKVIVTNTIPLNECADGCDKIQQLSVGELIGETIRRISNEESVSSLFVD